jgi:DNA polymerase-3 subunit epsilon
MSEPLGTLTAMSTSTGWVVVDVETTGTDPDTCRMLSLAALALAPDGAVLDTMSTLLNPGVDPGPTHIHGLTAKSLAGAPQFHDISTTLTTLLCGRTLVAHNADFDYGFLTAEAARARTGLPVEQLLCTVELAATLNLGLPNLRLATLADRYRIQQHRPHDALDDATVLARIFQQLLTLAARAGLPLPIRRVELVPFRHLVGNGHTSASTVDHAEKESSSWPKTSHRHIPGATSPSSTSPAFSGTCRAKAAPSPSNRFGRSSSA